MDRSPTFAALRVQWQVPGDAPYADLIADGIIRQNRRAGVGVVRPWILYSTFLVVGGVLMVAMWPFGLVLPVCAALGGILGKVVAPRQLAKNLRDQPTAHEPYTVTLDAEGFHVVSPSVADHLRWSVFECAIHDEADLLMLRTRGARFFRAIPMVTLDPAVDRSALVAEVNRLIGG